MTQMKGVIGVTNILCGLIHINDLYNIKEKD